MRAKKPNKPFCFRNKYVTPNLDPYSVCLDCQYKTECTTAILDEPDFEYVKEVKEELPATVDITAPECVEIIIKNDGKVVWINTENGCQFRACQIKVLEVKDERKVEDEQTKNV
jgi:hypothetical protein